MKLNKKYLFAIGLLLWFLLIYFLNEKNIISIDLSTIENFLRINSKYAMLIFIGLWLARLLVFVPGVTLMILGGVLFGPQNGFLLSLLGIMISESLVYGIGKLLAESRIKFRLNKKYPEIVPMIERYNYKFLGLGILCPIASTDVICFLSASTGINYLKFMLTVILANIPVILVYSYIGTGYQSSIYSVILLVSSISIITFYSVRMWYGLRVKMRLIE